MGLGHGGLEEGSGTFFAFHDHPYSGSDAFVD